MNFWHINVRQLVEAEILTCNEQLQHSVAFCIETCYVQVNPFHSSSAFQIETSDLFSRAKKSTHNDWFLCEMEKWIEIHDIHVKLSSTLYISYFWKLFVAN